MTEPIDETHRMSIELIRKIRQWSEARRREYASWEPAPYPRKKA